MPPRLDRRNLARKAWFALALLTAANAALLAGVELYARTIHVDRLVGELSRPGIPDADVEEVLLARKDSSIPRLAALLASGGAPVEARRRAAGILGRTADDRALPSLLEALSDADPRIRAAAVEGLGLMGRMEALRALARAAGDESTEVRVRVASSATNYVFATGVDPEALDLVCRLARDPAPEVRSVARMILGKVVSDVPLGPDDPRRVRAREALEAME